MKRFTLMITLALYALSAAAARPDFRIMSFNILRGDLNGPDHLWASRKNGALAMIAADAPDILGLQECNMQQREDISAAFPDYAWHGIQVSGKTDDTKCSGNYIFYRTSRFEKVDGGTLWFSCSGEPGSYVWSAKKPRNCNWVRLKDRTGGQEFYYFCMHTQNGVEAANSRSMSNVLLLAKMREINSDNLPVIFSGDLNSAATEIYFDELRRYFDEARDVCPVADKGRTLNVFGEKTRAVIDHIFFNGFEGVEYGVDRTPYEGVTYVSDHYPVWADLRYAQECCKDIHKDLDPDGAPVLKVATYNIWNDANRSGNMARGRAVPEQSWEKTRSSLVSLIREVGADIMGLQDMSARQVDELPRLLKKAGLKSSRLWAVSVSPSSMAKSLNLGFLYDSRRITLSSQDVFWLSETPGEESRTWNDGGTSACISAVATDKQTGKKFMIMCTQYPQQKAQSPKCASVLDKVAREKNPSNLPVILFLDANATPKSRTVQATLNRFLDTYAVQRDTWDVLDGTVSGVFSDEKAANTVKKDYVCVRNAHENGVVVLSHKVYRNKVTIDGKDVFPSWHCPVAATLALTEK